MLRRGIASDHGRTVALLLTRRYSSQGVTDDQKRRLEAKPFSEMPGEIGWPVVGAINMYKNITKGRIDYEGSTLSSDLHNIHGDIFRLKLPGNNWIVSIQNPDDFEALFRAEGEYPSRGIEGNMMWIYNKINLPPPMFFSSGVIWKKTRSNAAKQIIPRRIANFVGPMCEIAEDFIRHLESMMDSCGNISDVTPEMNKWSFQGASYFVYGEKINTYSSTYPVQQEFIEAGTEYIKSLGPIVNAIPIYKLFPTKLYKEYVRIVHRMHAAGSKVLENRFENLKEDIASGVVDETKAVGLLDQWMIERKFTHNEALSISYDMLSSGIDTTASTTSFVFYELAKHRDVQQQAVDEVSSVLGNKANPSWEDLQKMTVIRNCMKESMRMHMPLTVIPRVLARDEVLGGYLVPAGTMITALLANTAKDERYVMDPQKFYPDRWNKESAEKLHPFISLPFGFGPRSCYGRQLAELEMFSLLVKLLPKYELSTDLEKIKQNRTQTVLRPAEPLKIKFTKRLHSEN